MPEEDVNKLKLMLWLDMETTGDRPTMHTILEVAWFATDWNLNKLHSTRCHLVVHANNLWKTEMIPVVREMHEASGLVADIDSRRGNNLARIERNIIGTIELVEEEMRALQYTAFEWVLAGSGVSQLDSPFIQRYMPHLQARLAYYFIDIGQVRRFMRLAGVDLPVLQLVQIDQANKTHRADSDIENHHLEACLWREHLQALRGTALMALTEIVQVQAALLHDALSKARLIAPTKGAAFDRSAGIMVRLKSDHIEIRATDEELYFCQRVEAYPTISDKSFRLPSSLVAPFVAGLPMNQEEHQVKFLWDEDDPIWMTVKFGKTKLKARMKMIVGGAFPDWEVDDYDTLTEAQELVSRIEQIAWACGDNGVVSGTHIDGVNMISTNGSALAAIAPCAVTIDSPITAVMKPLVPLIKLGTEVRVRATESRLTIALDRETQLRTTVLRMPYPNIVDVLRARPLPCAFTVNRQRMIDALNRLLIFVKNDNLPRCNIGVRDGYIECSLLGDRGDIQDATSLEDQVYEEDHDYKFNPNWVIQVLESFTGSKVRIFHNNESPTRHPFHVIDPTNAYEAWIMPMSDTV